MTPLERTVFSASDKIPLNDLDNFSDTRIQISGPSEQR